MANGLQARFIEDVHFTFGFHSLKIGILTHTDLMFSSDTYVLIVEKFDHVTSQVIIVCLL